MSYLNDYALWVSEQAEKDVEVAYQDHLKIAMFKEVGFFLKPYVVRGGTATIDAIQTNKLNVTAAVVSLNDNVMYRDGVSFIAEIPSANYVLAFLKEGDFYFGLGNPPGANQVDYFRLFTVSTNASGVLTNLVDVRGVVGGFILKDEYGLNGYVTQTQYQEVINARQSNFGNITYANLDARLEGDRVARSLAGLDLNDVVVNGDYYCYGTTLNKPTANNGVVTHTNAASDSSFSVQVYTEQWSLGTIYRRVKSSNVWSPWTEILTQNMRTSISFSQNSTGLQMNAGNVASYMHLADFPGVTSEFVEARFFRNVNTTGNKSITVFKGDGTATAVFRISDGTINVLNGIAMNITGGNGSPEGVVTANSGSIYLNRTGGANTSLYVKETGTGNTGWVAK